MTLYLQNAVLCNAKAFSTYALVENPLGLKKFAERRERLQNIVTDGKKLNNEYLFYFLKLQIEKLNQIGGGTTFKELSKTTLELFKINISDIKIQQKIAAVLSALDAKIELNK